jgi:hypothetical protein
VKGEVQFNDSACRWAARKWRAQGAAGSGRVSQLTFDHV